VKKIDFTNIKTGGIDSYRFRANLGVNLVVSHLLVLQGASTNHSGSENVQLKRIAIFPSLDTQSNEHCSGLGQHSCMMKQTFFVFVLPCPSSCFSLVHLYQTQPTKKKRFLHPGHDHRDMGLNSARSIDVYPRLFCRVAQKLLPLSEEFELSSEAD
jgi:hypothetical protein